MKTLRLPFLLGLLAATVRGTALIHFNFHIHDYEWGTVAQNMLVGRGYVFSWEYIGSDVVAVGFPGMAFILYFLQLVFGPGWLGFWIWQMLMAIGSVVLLDRVGYQMHMKDHHRLFACILFCFDPALVLYGSIKVHEVSTLIFMVLVLFYFANRALDSLEFCPRRFVILGLLAGLGMYIRPTLFFILPLYLLLTIRHKNKKRLGFVLSIVLSLMCMLPWMVRNQIRLGKPVLATNGSFLLWRGNNPYATGGAVDSFGTMVMQRAGYYEDTLYMSELERQQFFRKKAVDWIQKNPESFFYGIVKKFYYFWWFSPQSGVLYPGNWIIIYKIYYTFLLLGLILGVYCYQREQISWEWLFVSMGFMLFISMFQSLYYVEGRHRLILMPFFFLYTGFFLPHLQKIKFLPHRSTQVAPGLKGSS